MDSQIRQSGSVRIQELQIWILKDSFCGIVLKIREDLWKQVESLKLCWILGQRFKLNLLKSGFVLWSPKQYKSMNSWYKSSGTRFPDTNPATLENNNLQKETNTLKAKVLKDTYIVSVLVYNNRSYYSIWTGSLMDIWVIPRDRNECKKGSKML
jgi:hypothetical protein